MHCRANLRPHCSRGGATRLSVSAPQRPTAASMASPQQQHQRRIVALNAAAVAVAASAGDAALAPPSPAALGALPFPPHAPLAGSEAGSFAEATIKERLPAIMGTVLSDFDRAAAAEFAGDAAAAQQLAAAAAEVRRLQAEMPADVELTPLAAPAGATAALAEAVAAANAAVAAWQARARASGSSTGGWLGLPWLVIECYLYVRLATIIAAQPALATAGYDPFAHQKLQALLKSGAAVGELAAAAEALLTAQQQAGGAAADRALTKKHLNEVFQYALWGNKTDLSMLVDASKLDEGASVRGAAAGAGDSGYLIADDFEAVWALLGGQADGGRIDIVLDNAGLELYTDLVLADFLVTSNLAAAVELHGKPLPWFVSDTRAADLEAVLAALEAPAPPAGMAVPEAQWAATRRLAARWRGHLQEGRWRYREAAFWATPYPFWWMRETAPALYADLAESKLIIFKGDLNYRKLAYDCRWPADAPFAAALGPFRPAPLVTLRTLKADVIAGLAAGREAALDARDAQWRVNGKFGVVQFAGRA